MAGPQALVTAAGGNTGRATTLSLLERGVDVRAMVRRDDRRAEELRRAGAQVVVGDLTRAADLRAALRGMRRAYYAAPFIPGALDSAVMFAAVAEEERLDVVVALSQWLADPSHPSVHTRRSWLAQRVFSWMPSVGSVTVDPGFFADNYMAALEPVAQFGLMAMPLGAGRNAPPSNEDIGRLVAQVLADPEPHLGMAYRPTGPALLAPGEIAAAFGRVLGRPVRYRDVPFRMLAKVGRSLGYDAFALAQLRWYMDEYRRDAFAVGAPSDDVRAVTGVPAESFETTVGRYVERRPGATRSPGAWARALGGLLRAVATPAPSARRYARRVDPASTAGMLAVDSPEWRASRAAPRRGSGGTSVRDLAAGRGGRG